MLTRGEKKEISLFLNGSHLVTFEYSDGEITMSERTNIDTMDSETFKSLFNILNTWVRSIEERSRFPRSEYSLEYKKKNGKYEAKLKMGLITVMDAEYVKSTGIVTFQPRVEITLKMSDFLLFFGVLEMIGIEMERY